MVDDESVRSFDVPFGCFVGRSTWPFTRFATRDQLPAKSILRTRFRAVDRYCSGQSSNPPEKKNPLASGLELFLHIHPGLIKSRPRPKRLARKRPHEACTYNSTWLLLVLHFQ